MRHPALLTLLLAGAFSASGQVPYDLQVNTPGTTPGMDTILTWHATASGAILTTSPADSVSYIVRRYAPDGQPVWSRKVSSPDLMALKPGPRYWFSGGGDGLYPAFYWDRNEGLYYCSNDAVEFRADQSGMDTVLAYVSVYHLDANANVTQAFEVVNEVIVPWAELENNGVLMNSKMAVQPDGGYHIISAIRTEWNNVRMIQVMRFDASGNHQWTRLYHDPGNAPMEGPSSDLGQLRHWIADDAGGLYVDDRYLGDGYLHVNGSGICDWSISLTSPSTDQFSLHPTFTVDPSDNSLLVGDIWEGFVSKDLVLRIDVAGNLVAADAYDRGLFEQGPVPTPHVRPNGELVLGYDHPGPAGVESYALLVADQNGVHTRYKDHLGLQSGQVHSRTWSNGQLIGDMYHLQGMNTVTDTIWWTSETRPVFAAFDVNMVWDCLLYDTTVTRNSALGQYTSTSLTPWDQTVADTMHTIVPGVVSVSPVPDLTVSDYCGILLSASAVPDGPDLGLRTNLVMAGEPIELLHTRPGILTVHDVDGRRYSGVIRTSLASSLSIGTTNWAPGMKLLQWQSDDGSTHRTLKVMVH